MHVEALEDRIDDLLAVGEMPPGVLMPGIEPEWNAGGEGQRRILADVEVEWGVGAFDAAVLHGVKGLQPGDQLAGGKSLHLKAVVGRFRQISGQRLGRAVDRVELLREA
jgi:hypothetical protein